MFSLGSVKQILCQKVSDFNWGVEYLQCFEIVRCDVKIIKFIIHQKYNIKYYTLMINLTSYSNNT